MGFWPWDWAQEAAQDSTEAIMAWLATTAVGLFIAAVSVGILFKKLPVPGGPIVSTVIGVAGAAFGLLLVLGVIL